MSSVPWNNPSLVLYHGTYNEAAADIVQHGVNRSRGTALADFGQGFYTTTNLRQAKNWANVRCRKLRKSDPTKQVYASLLEFQIDRGKLANLQELVFIIEGDEYWDFVEQFRLKGGAHQIVGNVVTNYDVVFGPVCVWPELLILKDCDQISFHTDVAVRAVGPATLKLEATQTDPFLRVR